MSITGSRSHAPSRAEPPSSHISSRSHHSAISHRPGPKEDDQESIAPPKSVASFAAPTVLPLDSVSQIGSRPYEIRSEAARSRSHYSGRHSSHSSNAGSDDASSGLLTEKNLAAHTESQRGFRASTAKPPPEQYVEVLEERTVTTAYDSTRSHSHHSGVPRSRVEASSRVAPSHVSRSHASRALQPYVESSLSAATPKPPTVFSRRSHSTSPTRISASRAISHTHHSSHSKAPASTPSHVSSQPSHRSYRYEPSPSGLQLSPTSAPTTPGSLAASAAARSRSATPTRRVVDEVAVYEDVPRPRSGLTETWTVEVESDDEQAQESTYKIRRRHEFPVHYDS